MHKWLQLPATPTDDPLATVYPINQYKKSHVYAVTRINPIYVDDEHHGTWNKSGSSGYDSQPHSDHSSLDKNSPPATKSDRSSAGSAQRTAAPWLSPIKEGVIDARPYCIPRPVWPGRDGRVDAPPPPPVDADVDGTGAAAAAAAAERIPRARCCRHCARCRCRGRHGTSSTSTSSGSDGANGHRGRTAAGGCGSYSAYSSAYGGSAAGTISTNSSSTSSTTVSSGAAGGRGDRRGGRAGSCSDDAHPASSSGTGSVGSADRLQSPLHAFDPRFGCGALKTTLDDNWNSIDLRLNQKTDGLQYDCGAMLRGLQFTLDAQQAEKLMQKIKVGKKHRCWCRFVTALLGLIMFLVSVITVSLTLTRGQKMFGSL